MANAAPKLTPTASNQPDYVPISWTAVASLIVACLFVFLLISFAIFVNIRNQPLVEPWLLVLPITAVVLAFTARKQIDSSEGTRTGLVYAKYGWWIAVLAGLGYSAYLLAIESTVRSDAQREFQNFIKLVQEIDPEDPQHPKVYEACLRIVAPGQRGQVRNRSNPQEMERVFREELARFRQLDVTRIIGRNREEVELSNFGVQDWKQTANKIECTLSARMTSPEGVHTLVIPMQATIDKGIRQWQVVAPANGFVRKRSLTRLGWLMEAIENSGRGFLFEFLNILSLPEEQPTAYIGYVNPNTTPAASGTLLSTSWGRGALAGGPAGLPPRPVGYSDNVDKLFFMADGSRPNETNLAYFRSCWDNGLITMGGYTMEDNPDVNPILRINESDIELSLPIELRLGGLQNTAEAARGKLLIRAKDPEVIALIEAAKKEQSTALTEEPPDDLLPKRIPWRVINIRSDLRLIPIRSPDDMGPPN